MYTKLEQLEDIAYQSDVQIHNFRFSDIKKAACVLLGDCKTIALDRLGISSTAEEVEILAEEIGHFETGALYIVNSTYNTPVARSNRIKCEGTAKRWAYENLLKPDEIESAIAKNLGDIHLAADDCQVTVEFMNAAISYYRSCGIVFNFDVEICDDAHY